MQHSPARPFTARGLLSICVLSLMAFCVSSAVMASEFRKGNSITIGRLEQVLDDIYIYGQRLTVEGIIDGDLSAFAYTIEIDGEVSQSANLFAREIRHAGRVNGSLRGFAEKVRLTGYVLRSAVLAGADVEIDRGAVIDRDLSMFGGNLDMDGAVKGKMIAKGGTVRITGVITGDVEVEAERLSITAPAVITGNVIYTSKNEAEIDSTGGVTISGAVIWNKPDQNGGDGGAEDKGPFTSFVLRTASLFAAFIFGLLMIAFFRPYMESAVHQVSTRFSVSFAAGLLGMLLLFLAGLFFFISVASLLVGLIIISGNWWVVGLFILVFSILALPVTSFGSITGAVMFYTGKIVLGLLIGYVLLRRVRPDTTPLAKLPLLLGLVILSLLFAIPGLGILLYMLASIIGFGAILLGVKNFRKGEQPQPPSGLA